MFANALDKLFCNATMNLLKVREFNEGYDIFDFNDEVVMITDRFKKSINCDNRDYSIVNDFIGMISEMSCSTVLIQNLSLLLKLISEQSQQVTTSDAIDFYTYACERLSYSLSSIFNGFSTVRHVIFNKSDGDVSFVEKFMVDILLNITGELDKYTNSVKAKELPLLNQLTSGRFSYASIWHALTKGELSLLVNKLFYLSVFYRNYELANNFLVFNGLLYYYAQSESLSLLAVKNNLKEIDLSDLLAVENFFREESCSLNSSIDITVNTESILSVFNIIYDREYQQRLIDGLFKLANGSQGKSSQELMILVQNMRVRFKALSSISSIKDEVKPFYDLLRTSLVKPSSKITDKLNYLNNNYGVNTLVLVESVKKIMAIDEAVANEIQRYKRIYSPKELSRKIQFFECQGSISQTLFDAMFVFLMPTLEKYQGITFKYSAKMSSVYICLKDASSLMALVRDLDKLALNYKLIVKENKVIIYSAPDSLRQMVLYQQLSKNKMFANHFDIEASSYFILLNRSPCHMENYFVMCFKQFIIEPNENLLSHPMYITFEKEKVRGKITMTPIDRLVNDDREPDLENDKESQLFFFIDVEDWRILSYDFNDLFYSVSRYLPEKHGHITFELLLFNPSEQSKVQNVLDDVLYLIKESKLNVGVNSHLIHKHDDCSNVIRDCQQNFIERLTKLQDDSELACSSTSSLLI